jgi:hypothetical protein
VGEPKIRAAAGVSERERHCPTEKPFLGEEGDGGKRTFGSKPEGPKGRKGGDSRGLELRLGERGSFMPSVGLETAATQGV